MACRQKILIFGNFQGCISNFVYTSLENTKNENFLTANHQKVAWKPFSRASNVPYCSKRWRGWSGLSIAPNLDRIRRGEATNDENEECRTTIAPETLLKKETHWLKYYRSIRILLLIFFIFWINTVYFQNWKKNIWWYRTLQKMVILGGGSGSWKYKDFWYISVWMYFHD